MPAQEANARMMKMAVKVLMAFLRIYNNELETFLHTLHNSFFPPLLIHSFKARMMAEVFSTR